MALSDTLHITTKAPDASFAGASTAEGAREAAEARNAELSEQLETLNEILAKPLNEILADRDRFKESVAAWDAFGAMWMLSQRAMKSVALELAAQQGISEQEVVARAMARANEVLNGDEVDLGGTIAAPQMAHIARHKPFLRKQFRPA